MVKFGDTISSFSPSNMLQNSSIPQLSTPSSKMVPIPTLQIGDKIEIRSGEIVPIDGRIIEGTGHLDETH